MNSFNQLQEEIIDRIIISTESKIKTNSSLNKDEALQLLKITKELLALCIQAKYQTIHQYD